MTPLDSGAKAFLIGCAVLFLAAVGLRLNGSSAFIWTEVLKDTGNNDALLLSTPKSVRSDEWMVWTPALISQFRHNFPAENPSLGAGKAPFLYSLPVRHYTMFFRPQLYGFFLFDLERGYSWYWNVKVFGLLASMFMLVRMLTRSTPLSLFGSLSIFFSNYVQWWFSCPPMLPEMLSSWAIALVAGITLTRKVSWPVRLLAVAVFIISSVNFILCLYPPFQIPLVYLGVLVFGAWWYQERARNNESLSRIAQPAIYLFTACIIVAAILVPFFIECRSTFEMLSATSYPGHRRSHGGELGWMQMFSGLVNFFSSATPYRDPLAQANDAANFFPLWIPVLAFTASDLWADRRKHAVALALLVVIIGLSSYALFPIPQWLCNVTLLSFCTEVRVLLAIGVANTLFVAITFPLFAKRIARMQLRSVAAIGCSLGLLLLLYLRLSAPANPNLLVPWRMGALLGAGLAVIALLIKAPQRVFISGFVGLLAASNALINPLMIGLGPLLRTNPGTVIQEMIANDPAAGWAAYESSLHSELLMAMGARVVSGLKTVPDLGFYEPIDASHRDEDIYNRYSFAKFSIRDEQESVELRSAGFPIHAVSIHPLNRALRARNVRYFLFVRPLPDSARWGIQLLRALPENRIWIYGVIPDTLSNVPEKGVVTLG